MQTTSADRFADQVPEPMLPRPFRVVAFDRETADTVTLSLRPEDGEALHFAPGQFTMMYVLGVGEVPVSISGDPHSPEHLVHTVRSVGPVTEAIVTLGVDGVVGIRGPYGSGWPVEEAVGKDLLVAAGGIGLAPLRPVLLHVLAHRDRFGAVSLVYGTRSPEDLLYLDELHAWRSRFDIDVEITVDRAAEGWFGDVGVVTGLLPRVEFEPGNTTAMVCGPEIMIKVVARQLASAGVRPENVYVSLERNMKCALGFCGHCQLGPDFVCRDGPVVPYPRVSDRLRVPEL